MILLLAYQAAPPASALTTLDALLTPISRELKVPVTAKGRLGRRLVYCRMAPQPAAQRLSGLAQALELDVERPDKGEGYRLVPRPFRGETTKDRLSRGWNEFVQLVGQDADGTPEAALRHVRLLLEAEEAGPRNGPEEHRRRLKARALTRLESPLGLFLYQALKRRGTEAVVAPYGKTPSTDDWTPLPENAAFPTDLGSLLAQNPDAVVLLCPGVTRGGIDWKLLALTPDADLVLASFSVEPARPQGDGLAHQLSPGSESLRLELRQDRPNDASLGLGSVANALGGKGRSFAAWCPSDVLAFRAKIGTLRQFEDETRDTARIRFRDLAGGWVGVRTDSPLSFVDAGVDWATTLPALDLYDQERLTPDGLRRYLASLTRTQLAALGNASYENRNLGFRYDGLVEGAALVRAALELPGELETGPSFQAMEVRSLTASARDGILTYLRSARFVEDFPPLFHPRSALVPARFQVERRVERQNGQIVLTASLRGAPDGWRRPLASFTLTLASAERPNDETVRPTAPRLNSPFFVEERQGSTPVGWNRQPRPR